ncbi:class I tRNA ligase family protein [Bradyrhizobium sp. HKCCYLS3013]|uniref:class I tRNA ligase family protein n=1 Tax=Bradyrhizobium sp. HKCCYLS3013 TaxID=3420735 RepID=UPI003EBA419A
MTVSVSGAIDALVAANQAAPARIVTAAFPFVPAELGLPHFASTYLPADTLNRVYRFLGYRSALVGGTDVHSIQVSRDGKTRAGADSLCEEFDRAYRRAFDSFRVHYDLYLRTDDEAHTRLTHAALRRLEIDANISPRPTNQLRCTQCDAAPPERLTRQPNGPAVCPWCGSDALTTEQATHLFVDLERLRATIVGDVALHSGARRWIDNILAAPLEPWCITRDNRVGMDLHRPIAGKSLYIWFESLVGYATLAQGLEDRGFPAAQAEFRHFFGKNILYHHGILWPVIARAALGIDNRSQACMRGFADSDCRWADAYRTDPALRLYTLLKVPDDGSDFRLAEAEFREFRRKIWTNKIENLLKRLALCEIEPRGPLEPDPSWQEAVDRTMMRISALADAGAVRRIAEETLRFVRYTGSLCVDRGILWSDQASQRGRAFGMRRLCLALLNLVTPGIGDGQFAPDDRTFLAGAGGRIDTAQRVGP